MYEIKTVFRSWENGALKLIYKEETTDEWTQAVGVFSIYALDSECAGCEIRRSDDEGYSQILMDYQPWVD